MKKTTKRVFSGLLSMTLLFSVVQASSLPLDNSNSSCKHTLTEVYGEPDSDIISNIGYKLADSNFGGFYYDEDGTLVVNVIDPDSVPEILTESHSPTSEINYQKVTYPLSTLETVCDDLVPYMQTLGISVLDANDVTNKIDIYLSDYSIKNREDILSLIGTERVSEDAINFIDYSDKVISFEGEKIDDEMETKKVQIPRFDQGDYIIVPGNKIYVNGYGYTLGPKKGQNTSYTAGHHFPVSTGVNIESSNKFMYESIAAATSAKFSGSCDAAVLQFNSQYHHTTMISNYTMSNPSVGTKVTMVGGYSGAKQGTVTAINARVNYAKEGVTLTNMAAGNYSCKEGDSGAAIFNQYSSLDSVTKCYGVQSGGAFTASGAWGGTSYFTMPKYLP